MRRQPCRPFTLLDVMILVAATAFGIVLARTLVRDALMLPQSLIWVSRPVTYFLLPWTLAFLPIRLRRPRPAAARLMCQPGMAACCAAAAVTAIDVLTRLVPRMVQYGGTGGQGSSRLLGGYWRGNSDHIGPAVAAAWLGLVLARRWRPEAGWIDRFGRVMGVLWLLALLLCEWRFGRWATNVTSRLWMGLR